MIKKVSFILLALFPTTALAVSKIGENNKTTSLEALLNSLKGYLLNFAGTFAVIFVIIGGFQYMTAGGNTTRAEAGKKTLTYAIIGVVVILVSELILAFLTSPGILNLFK